ncbi:ABC transporter ATP-binding protein [Robbsia sp. KACC 23696]|uniref:ABC transporter ATP-binding protein n=1 Tax=Robbsia sp. KACC 23696 TaxID=3149231 RepID=UPI00325C11B1
MTFLNLIDVGKRYGEVVAVEGINLSIAKGEFVSLLGPSGCGKTTTLQMIAGFVQASSGRIMLDGRDITREKPNKRGLGIVFQSYALFPHMRVADNVAFGLEMRGVSQAERAERVAQALKLVHLSRYADRYPRALSGGQRQRVALARALVIEPPVLLLDEPMSNLDAKLREAMQEELRDIQRTVGTTTLMVTHDQAEALSMSDRVVIMEAGRVAQIATPRAAYETPASAFVAQFVGRANLFDAEVLSNGGDRIGYGALVAPSARWTLDARTQTSPSEVGTVLQCCVRPEKLRPMADDETGLPYVDGTVLSAMFLGDQCLYRIDTPLGALIALWPNRQGPGTDVGARIRVGWMPESAHVLGQVDAGAVHG